MPMASTLLVLRTTQGLTGALQSAEAQPGGPAGASATAAAETRSPSGSDADRRYEYWARGHALGLRTDLGSATSYGFGYLHYAARGYLHQIHDSKAWYAFGIDARGAGPWLEPPEAFLGYAVYQFLVHTTDRPDWLSSHQFSIRVNLPLYEYYRVERDVPTQ